MMTMDRYQTDNAAHRIEGYFISRPGETMEQTFLRAQIECSVVLQNDANRVEQLTFEQFMESTGRERR